MNWRSFKVHEWLNSLIAAVALCVSAYLGFGSYWLKSESIHISSRPTGICSVQVGAAVSALCWSVIIANGSENRLSIIQAHWKRVLPSAAAILGFDFLTVDGSPLSFPINLDGGEGKQIMIRAVLMLTSDVADVNRRLGEDNRSRSWTLHDVQLRIAGAGLDILGNNVNPIMNGKDVIGWRWTSPFRAEVDLLTLKTGRGGAFSTTLTYPATTGDSVSDE